MRVTEWSLTAWIEHSEEVHKLEARLRDADREMFQAEMRHVREVIAIQKEAADIHFAQLNENMERTIEERGHFVSVESYLPFKEEVTRSLSGHIGEEKGGTKVLHWVVSVASILFGLIGILFAVFTHIATR